MALNGSDWLDLVSQHWHDADMAKTPPEHPRARLARLMEERRAQLGMFWRDVAEAAGLTTEGLRGVREGSKEIRPTTKAGIARALQWTYDSIDAILSGGDPTPVSEPTPTVEESLDRLEETLRSPGARAALRSAVAGLEAQLRVTEDPEEASALRRLIYRLGGPLPRERPDSTEHDEKAG